MPVADFVLLLASVFPHVEDPWPDTIGIELPFTLAGAGGLLAGFSDAEASDAERDRTVRKGGLHGFRLGALLYALALFNQVLFGL